MRQIAAVSIILFPKNIIFCELQSKYICFYCFLYMKILYDIRKHGFGRPKVKNMLGI